MTILLQDTVEGLRVRTEEGVWLDAPPIPGTFVVNAGELLSLDEQNRQTSASAY